MRSHQIGAFLLFVAIAAAQDNVVWYGTPEAVNYQGACQEQCCCPVCGSPTTDAFPYGLTVISITSNPPLPKVRGSTCHFSIWSDRSYNDTSGQPAVVPDTVFWQNYTIFGDYETHIAPLSCDCCRFSGVDTSCKEVVPAATYPRYFFIQGGQAQEYRAVDLHFMDGVQLNETDYVELRNDTYCGYLHPRPVVRQTNLTITNKTFTSIVSIPRLPSRGCYTVCYYASALTTPQWYNLGHLQVNKKPQTNVTYVFNDKDVLLAGNRATLTFFGRGLLSVFSDVAELRSTGVCGGASPNTTTATGTNGILDVIRGEEWCKPPVQAQITSQRPLNYIAIKYTDCGVGNRVYQSQVQWGLTLPVSSADTTYSVCYQQNGTWLLVGSVLVYGQQTAATALNQLYAATGGAAVWRRNSGWGGANACLFHGVRCNALGQVEKILLGRNNLTGTIPMSMFYADYFSTLTHLALDMNSLSGTIPREIGALRNLVFLDVGFNQLSGTLPHTLDDTALHITYMGNNALIGYVPSSVEVIGLSWSSYGNNLSESPPPLVAPGCPVDVMECSQKGSTDYGTTQCGNDGITEAACYAYGCCFNPQAPLVFGGTACFTYRQVSFLQYPPCKELSCSPQS